MSTKPPLSEYEREYIRATFPQLSVSEIAERLGRSRACVNKVVRAEGLREGCKHAPAAPPPPASAAPCGAVGRLEELRDVLRAALLSASPKEAAPLAREYRAVVLDLERMGGEDDPAARELDEISERLARKLHARR